MSEDKKSSLSAFIKAAIENKSGIWLITPAGIVFGQPATFEEYIAAADKRRPDPKSPRHVYPDDSEIWLIRASLRSGSTTFNLGPTVILGDHVAGWGLFTHLQQVPG